MCLKVGQQMTSSIFSMLLLYSQRRSRCPAGKKEIHMLEDILNTQTKTACMQTLGNPAQFQLKSLSSAF